MTGDTKHDVRTWSVALVSPPDVAAARRAATEAMTELGASVIRRTKFVTAVSEVARNALVHGAGGMIRFTASGHGCGHSVVAECIDRGPGIADVDQALRDGYTSGGGLGHGLGGAKRLVDGFEIVTGANRGTTVRLTCFEDRKSVV